MSEAARRRDCIPESLWVRLCSMGEDTRVLVSQSSFVSRSDLSSSVILIGGLGEYGGGGREDTTLSVWGKESAQWTGKQISGLTEASASAIFGAAGTAGTGVGAGDGRMVDADEALEIDDAIVDENDSKEAGLFGGLANLVPVAVIPKGPWRSARIPARRIWSCVSRIAFQFSIVSALDELSLWSESLRRRGLRLSVLWQGICVSRIARDSKSQQTTLTVCG